MPSGTVERVKKQFDISFFLFVFFIFTTTACHFKKSVSSHFNTVKIAVWINSPSSLDAECLSSPCREIKNLTHEGLFRLQYIDRRLTLRPTLAESWTYLDNKTLKIRIKNNIKASDNTPVTSSDFLDAWKLALSSRNLNEARIFFPILNARSFFEGYTPFSEVGIKCPDSKTIVMTLSSPSPQFVLSLANSATWLKPRPLKNPVRFYGPFLTTQNTSNSSYTLIKNPFYQKPASSLDKIEIFTVFDSKSAGGLVENKEVDILLNPSTSLLSSHPGEAISSMKRAVMAFNFNQGHLQNQKLRKSLIYSTDKSEWTQILRLNLFPISSLSPYHEGNANALNYFSPDKSKTLFKEALAEIQSDLAPQLSQLKPLQLVFSPELKDIAINLKYQWMKQLNIQVLLSPIYNSQNWNRHLKPDWDIILISVPPAGTTLFQSVDLMAKELRDLGADETTKSLKEVFKNFKTLPFENLESTEKYFNQAESILIEEQAIYFPLFSFAQSATYSSQLRDIVANPSGGIDLSQIKTKF